MGIAQTKTLDLANDSISKLIWTFAIPGIISQVMTAIYNLVDQVFIGRGISDIAIAATNISMPLTSIVTAVAALIGLGTAANFNLSMGRKDEDGAGHFLGNALIYLTFSGLVLGIFSFIFLKPMLYGFGATDAIFAYAYPYAQIICIGIPFGIFATGCSYLIRSDGNPNFAMAILLSGAIFNLFADPLFLFVFHMGISGIALATALGQVLSAFLGVYYLVRKFRTIRIKRIYFSAKVRILWEIIISGSAIFMTHVCAIIVQILQNNSFRYYGGLSVYGSEIPLAAIGAVSKVSMVLMSIVIGVALGCQPILSFNYGNKDYSRVQKTYLTAIRHTSIVSVAAFLILQLFPSQITALFGSGNNLFYDFAVRYIHIYLIMLFAGGILPVSSTFFTSIGKAKIGMYLTLLKQVVLLIPLTLILPKFKGIDGVLLAGPITDGIILVVTVYLVSRELRQIKTMNSEDKGKTNG